MDTTANPSSDTPSTLLAQAGHYLDPATGAVVPPLQASTTFARDDAYHLIGPSRYSRYGNPTVEAAEALLARLEHGAEALLFGSGLAAVAAVLDTLRPGDRIVAPRVMYHGTLTLMRRVAARRGLTLALYDPGAAESLGSAVVDGTRLVWVETPANPTWEVIDIAEAANAAHRAGAILCVDSTVAPPVTTRPLHFGADLVFHSASKYLNGHGDVLAGALVTRVTDDRWADIRMARNLGGAVLGAFEAWLLIRGLRTLPLRFARASENAAAIAIWLSQHPRVARVLYPGLPSHPGHDMAARQMHGGFGGMLSLLVNGDAAAAQSVAARLRRFYAAASLGGVESLVEHRASVEGPDSLVPPNLLRLSIGIEDVDDLIADLDQAFG